MIVALMAVGLVACTTEPAPAPLPTPSALSSEDAAFAAAEATYRAYVDAVNARREDPQSLPNPESFLTGAALESSRSAQQRFDAADVRLDGASQVVEVLEHSRDGSDIELVVCVDSSDTRLLNGDGVDITPANRQEVGALRVGVTWIKNRALIATSEISEIPC